MASAGKAPMSHEARTPERIRAHYLAERELADRVRRAATFEERRRLFNGMYDELFAKIPDHPRLVQGESARADRERSVDWNLAQLRPYLEPGCVFLEMGAGDCALAARVASIASRVYALDISDQSG